MNQKIQIKLSPSQAKIMTYLPKEFREIFCASLHQMKLAEFERDDIKKRINDTKKDFKETCKILDAIHSGFKTPTMEELDVLEEEKKKNKQELKLIEFDQQVSLQRVEEVRKIFKAFGKIWDAVIDFLNKTKDKKITRQKIWKVSRAAAPAKLKKMVKKINSK
jgi:hypothetical protein